MAWQQRHGIGEEPLGSSSATVQGPQHPHARSKTHTGVGVAAKHVPSPACQDCSKHPRAQSISTQGC
jgi:hypothetical protein